jgi:hypothetical protein
MIYGEDVPLKFYGVSDAERAIAQYRIQGAIVIPVA